MKSIYSLLLFVFSVSNAQTKPVNYNMWYQYLMNAKLDDKMTLTALSQYRSFDMLLDARLFVAAAYVDYSIDKKISVGGGGMFLLLESYDKNNNKKERSEKRIFQQATITDNIGRTLISHRFRIEERFLNNPNEFIVRLRYLTSFRIPLNKATEKQILYGIIKNEIRISAIKDKPFDSDRITIGTGFNLSKKSALEINLISQLAERKTSNYLNVVFRNKFDWRKKISSL
ncbi:DUF2490 domain-containing protein [Chishuiella sp.]|uniref:DUF2490 domain-containing protein n=1 Tax=Chishuiella sp. TaxID=1969467 RepID=UPI0028A76FE3|nr:DUF2490 domain-containing protein [Chishuiella sp.]